MNKESVRNEACRLLDELIKAKIYASYRSVLETMYETASNKKQYTKCDIIQSLITDEIWS